MVAKTQSFAVVLLGILVIVLIAAGVWYAMQTQRGAPAQTAPPLGAQLYDRAQNPLKDQLPETNPFAPEVNPLDEIYANPFAE